MIKLIHAYAPYIALAVCFISLWGSWRYHKRARDYNISALLAASRMRVFSEELRENAKALRKEATIREICSLEAKKRRWRVSVRKPKKRTTQKKRGLKQRLNAP